MATQADGSVSPIYAMRESLNLQSQIKEAKVLGPAGMRTDLIQKLTVTPPPSAEELTAPPPPKEDTKSVTAANGKYGFISTRPAEAPKPKETAPAPVVAANVYRETQGFAAVA
ncbi:MAG: hypothetical protein HQK86_09390 [Nitrospinae bacterium]|nr:hypothetical protein [Nitrospinota bacterium]